jgi:hypothetical protein
VELAMQLNLLRYILVGVLLMAMWCPASAVAQEPTGRWAGRWTTYQPNGRGHQGTIRANLRPNGDGSYQGTFSGRFFVVIPYFYRATVVQDGDMLYSTKQLGPLGNYQMQMLHSPGSLTGSWTTGDQSGGIMLYRK